MSSEAVHAALTSQYVQKLFSTKSYQVSRRLSFNRWERPDIEQELIAHVLKQAHHFDPSRGSVNTFIARVVDSAIAMLIRDRRRLKRGQGRASISLERTHVHDDRDITLAQVVVENDLRRRYGGQAHNEQQDSELSADLATAVAGLTPIQQQIALRLMEVPEAAVAKELGISRRQVRKAVDAIRERIESAGVPR